MSTVYDRMGKRSEMAIFLVEKKLRLMRFWFHVRKIWKAHNGGEKNVYAWDMIPLYKKIWEQTANDLHADFTELAEGIWEIRIGDKKTRICGYKLQLDDPVLLEMAGKKSLCYELMRRNGLPVPQYARFGFEEIDTARHFMQSQDGFFVVKPESGTSSGLGITTHIKTYGESIRAIALASLYYNKMIIERLVPGESYRFLVLDRRVIHVSRRRGVRVQGDGESTIAQLLARNRSLTVREDSVGVRAGPAFDRDSEATLQSQGLSADSIPEKGRVILAKSFAKHIRTNAEVRTVYDEDVTDLVCDDIREQAISAAQVTGIRMAGVDIITIDPSISLEASGGVISEINTTPGMHHHYRLPNDKGFQPAHQVLQFLLSQ